ncbi:hypothetical protein KP003_14365 [Geomonas nitrogeniifigens]|uniref:hypothetical protein n=1 Tax=Geomonas diazotrophica TaxID=2843197 RepID=UPI001C2C8956|nr:hypothetical protein [Geomonas nitrogeniifigens]QXE85561.1 hypothetical protein KP003_14365 [Geomonas nitrogeniifigens]
MLKVDIKRLKSIINKTRSSLKWRVVEYKNTDAYCFSIFSDSTSKIHNIYYPDQLFQKTEQNLVGFLHELCHAYLAETVHPQFGGIFFWPETSESIIDNVKHVFLTAQDWFVDGMVAKLCGTAFKQILSDDCDMLHKLNERMSNNDKEFEYGSALIFAQYAKYLNSDMAIDDSRLKAVKILLSIDPQKISLAKLELLTAQLLGIENTYACKAEFNTEVGFELFRVSRLFSPLDA